MYSDQYNLLRVLSDEDAGRLMKAVFHYADTQTDPDFEPPMLALFYSFKIIMDRDMEKYKDKCAKKVEAGRKGGLAKQANAKSAIAKVADNDNESVNGNENVNDITTHASPVGSLETVDSKQKAVPPQKDQGPPFEDCWQLYGRKGNKQTALRYWKKLKPADREAIKERIPAYIRNRDRVYRKDFQGWINPANRMWEDEIAEVKDESGGCPYV